MHQDKKINKKIIETLYKMHDKAEIEQGKT